MVDFSGSTLASPGFEGDGEIFLTGAPIDFSGATTAIGFKATGDGSRGQPPADYTGATTARPGFTAQGVTATTVQSRSGRLWFVARGAGTSQIVEDTQISGTGSPQAERATSTGAAQVDVNIQGVGSPQAERATSVGRAVIQSQFDAQGVADAFVETYLKVPVA